MPYWATVPNAVAAAALFIVAALILVKDAAKNVGTRLRAWQQGIGGVINYFRQTLGELFSLQGKEEKAKQEHIKKVDSAILRKRQDLESEILKEEQRQEKRTSGAVDRVTIREAVTERFERKRGKIEQTLQETKDQAVDEARKAAADSSTPFTDEAEQAANARGERRFAERHGSVGAPTTTDKLIAWGTRILYLLLALVCIFSDFVFTSARLGPILSSGAFTPPPWLEALYQQLTPITGVLFVCTASLGGLLFIDEYADGVSNYVKTMPYPSRWFKVIGAILSVAMVISAMLSVVALVVLSILNEYSIGYPVIVEVVVFLGIAVIIFIGAIFTIGAAREAGLFLLVLALFLIAAILGPVAWIALALIIAVVAVFALINAGLWNLWALLTKAPGETVRLGVVIADIFNGQGSNVRLPKGQSGLAIVGYGNNGSTWAIEICKQYKILFGRGRGYIRWVGTDSQGIANAANRQAPINLVGAKDISAATYAIGPLVTTLKGEYQMNGVKDETKPLLWIAEDGDLQACLPELRQLKDNVSFKDVRLVILWLLTPGSWQQPAIRQIAADLLTWSAEMDTPLMTTCVIEQASGFARKFPQSYATIAQRSIASMLGAGRATSGENFATVAKSLQRTPFTYLSAASTGLYASGAPGIGDVSRQRGNSGGKVDVAQAEASFVDRANDMFGDALSSIQTQPDAARPAEGDPSLSDWKTRQSSAHVYAIVPPARYLLGKPATFMKALSGGLSEKLEQFDGVPPGRVTAIRTVEEQDTGISIRDEVRNWDGSYFGHLTVLRGVVNAAGAAVAPVELQATPAAQGQADPAQNHQPSPQPANVNLNQP